MNKARKIKEGKITYDAFPAELWRGVLLSFIDFNSPIPQTQKRRMLNKIIFKTRERNKITVDEFIDEIRSLEKEYLDKDKTEFHLFTHIQLENSFPFKSLTVSDVQMMFNPKVGKYNRERIEQDIKYLKVEEPNLHFQPIVLKTLARCEFEARDKSYAALNIFRAALNMIINFGSIRFWDFTPEIKPLHKVFIGPLVTLHKPDGSLALNSYDLEDFTNDVAPQNLSRHMKGINKLPYFLRKITKTSKVSSHACESLIRYIRALDKKDYGSTYLQLWSTLEYLTNTDKYEMTIRRTASIFKDYNETLYILESFRKIRNGFVHEHKTEDISIMAVCLLKMFVEKHILNLIHNPYNVQTINEYGRVLDLLKMGSLIRESSLLKIALKKKKLLEA